MFKRHKKQQADDEVDVEQAGDVSTDVSADEATDEADPLSDSEKQQFAAWLEKQPPDRRKHYLKLARAYGFPEE